MPSLSFQNDGVVVVIFNIKLCLMHDTIYVCSVFFNRVCTCDWDALSLVSIDVMRLMMTVIFTKVPIVLVVVGFIIIIIIIIHKHTII
jgi:hypothetical protein